LSSIIIEAQKAISGTSAIVKASMDFPLSSVVFIGEWKVFVLNKYMLRKLIQKYLIDIRKTFVVVIRFGSWIKVELLVLIPLVNQTSVEVITS
jgi:hypothetical protein